MNWNDGKRQIRVVLPEGQKKVKSQNAKVKIVEPLRGDIFCCCPQGKLPEVGFNFPLG
jgi:hypothetical protein